MRHNSDEMSGGKFMFGHVKFQCHYRNCSYFSFYGNINFGQVTKRSLIYLNCGDRSEELSNLIFIHDTASGI